MSAKNYTTCPKCTQLARIEEQRKAQEARDSYGKVSQEVWIDMVRQASVEEPLSTLAEYYEWDFQKDGSFWIRYHCQCKHCDFEFKTRHSVGNAGHVVQSTAKETK